MAKKKKEETAVEETQAEEKTAKGRKAKADEEPSIVESVIETVSSAVETVAETVSNAAETVAVAVGLTDAPKKESHGGNRAQRVGVVTSDKMTKQ
ncbi:MAG: hypothetical protein HC846_12325 [Blastocatellia bacterium]|nr:hypothetical protein [Blastocatellia bacterium]